ncbi:MAG: polysaccharide pyruvyl transferase family protein [Selenomonadaceae bacterium]|nr:polysaccharide pyruvyl transferase family protein [Selenomonadaceae bacterium]
MKVGQLTLNDYDSYGNMLQKYALYRTLKKFADTVEILWLDSINPFTPYVLELNRQEVGNLRDVAFKSVSQNKFKEFNDANMKTRFDIPHLSDIADDYDYFVIGSDQVWNPNFVVPGRFLDFAPTEKRIAYAASIAVSKLPERVIENYRQKILEMAHVSVREREGCNLIEKITGKRPVQVLDPVFLLSVEEWREIAKRPTWLNQKKYERGYLLTYFFNGKPPEQVNALAAKLDLPVINLKDIDNFNHYITGVEEFLYLVDHATLFCTHSFHGAAFSLIFKRPFIVYFIDSVLISRFTRVSSLLDMVNLRDRVTDSNLNIKVADPLTIDFSRCDEVLPAEQKRSLKFLANALWQ